MVCRKSQLHFTNKTTPSFNVKSSLLKLVGKFEEDSKEESG